MLLAKLLAALADVLIMLNPADFTSITTCHICQGQFLRKM
jgi:hypothetical protein